jgi:hypothetical protein
MFRSFSAREPTMLALAQLHRRCRTRLREAARAHCGAMHLPSE